MASALIITTVLLGIFCASMEAMVTATLLPSIIASMESFDLYPWLSASYLMAALISTPVFGKMADLFGYRRIYCLAVILFLVGSALCGTSTSMGQLVVARTVQGVGSAGLITLSVVLFGALFPVERRTQMQAMLSATWAISSILGPIVGALSVEYFSWRWAFFINVPAALLILLAVSRFGEISPKREEMRALDWKGVFLFTAGLLPLVAAVLSVGQLHLGLLQIALALTGVVFTVLFLERLAHSEEPLIPTILFQRREAVISVIMIALSGGLLFSLINFLPLFVQGVLGEPARVSGYVVTSIAVAMFVGAVFSGVFLNRLGFRVMSVTGASLVVIGFCLLALVLYESTIWHLVLCNAIIGIGLALVTNALIIAMQAIASTTTLGSASSLVHFFRMLGGTSAIALMGGVQLGVFRRHIEEWAGTTRASELVDAVLASPEKVFDLTSRTAMEHHELQPIADGLLYSLQDVFLLCLVVALGLLYLASKMPSLTPKELSTMPSRNQQENPGHL